VNNITTLHWSQLVGVFVTLSRLRNDLCTVSSGNVKLYIQGGPTKVKPLTFLLVKVECIGKIQWFFGTCKLHTTTTGMMQIFYANFVIINT